MAALLFSALLLTAMAPRKPNQPRRRGGGRPGRTSIRTNLSVTVISFPTDARLGLVRAKFVCLSLLIEGDAGPPFRWKSWKEARLKTRPERRRDMGGGGGGNLFTRGKSSESVRRTSGKERAARLVGGNCGKESRARTPRKSWTRFSRGESTSSNGYRDDVYFCSRVQVEVQSCLEFYQTPCAP